jgi:hypothetical protein
VQPIREVVPDLREDIAAIVDRALAFHPSERFPSARVMQQWVRDALGSLPDASIPEAPPSQSPTVISHANAPRPPGRTGRVATSFLLAAAAAAVVHLAAAETTGDPRLPAPHVAGMSRAPTSLGMGLPYDLGVDILSQQATAAASAAEAPAPAVELADAETIDLDAIERQAAESSTSASAHSGKTREGNGRGEPR